MLLASLLQLLKCEFFYLTLSPLFYQFLLRKYHRQNDIAVTDIFYFFVVIMRSVFFSSVFFFFFNSVHVLLPLLVLPRPPGGPTPGRMCTCTNVDHRGAFPRTSRKRWSRPRDRIMTRPSGSTWTSCSKPPSTPSRCTWIPRYLFWDVLFIILLGSTQVGRPRLRQMAATVFVRCRRTHLWCNPRTRTRCVRIHVQQEKEGDKKVQPALHDKQISFRGEAGNLLLARIMKQYRFLAFLYRI